MTTLGGSKVRRRREAPPKETRAVFGARYNVAGGTVQGWEEEGKIPKTPQANALARDGIAAHADWHVPASCPRCQRDTASVAACSASDCPIAVKWVA